MAGSVRLTGARSRLPWMNAAAPSVRQFASEHVAEDVQALLGSAVQADRLPRLHGIEGDKVAVPLARTESLSSDTVGTVG